MRKKEDIINSSFLFAAWINNPREGTCSSEKIFITLSLPLNIASFNVSFLQFTNHICCCKNRRMALPYEVPSLEGALPFV